MKSARDIATDLMSWEYEYDHGIEVAAAIVQQAREDGARWMLGLAKEASKSIYAQEEIAELAFVDVKKVAP